jgi:hypothetical protein
VRNLLMKARSPSSFGRSTEQPSFAGAILRPTCNTFVSVLPSIRSIGSTSCCLGTSPPNAFVPDHQVNQLLKTLVTATVASASLSLGGCGRVIVYCEGELEKSPDGECFAQLVQDVATRGAYAVVECKDWHYVPYPDWNAVILGGARTGRTLRQPSSRFRQTPSR